MCHSIFVMLTWMRVNDGKFDKGRFWMAISKSISGDIGDKE